MKATAGYASRGWDQSGCEGIWNWRGALSGSGFDWTTRGAGVELGLGNSGTWIVNESATEDLFPRVIIVHSTLSSIVKGHNQFQTLRH
jgi:hypothetical protein